MKEPYILDVTKDVKWIGAIDHDIVTFDVVMETKFGTTYNSYFIDADKKAVFETVKERFWPEYEAKLRALINPEDLAYIIMNHTEPDHSGCVGKLLEIAPQAVVVGTGTAIRYLKDLVAVPFKSLQVKDGMELDLGNKTVRFVSAPNLHWPDTMYSYLQEDQLLFTCDSFGAHYADERMFDDEVGNWDEAFKYYFDVILKPFSKYMLKAIEKIRPLSIKMICTGHGPILRSNWKRYVDLSEQFANEELQMPQTKRVYIPYVSAYHKTGQLAEAIGKGVESVEGLEAVVMDVEHTPLGDIDMQVSMASGLIIGCPTINQNILLPIYRIFAVVNPLRDKGKLAGGFGSYGWSGEGMKIIRTNLENLKLAYTETDVFVKFSPNDDDLQRAENYGRRFGELLLEKVTN
ncbi:MAG: FprA family A-type flavoprotein [Bacteroidetes bacterium]|nr:FprA family A-type flavoprotein [Bacteroidota bacterium]MBU1577834.1 FprA family A-type flavoprotein [Bacteroidota bacterium]MBU2558006.1 FprA family A-type flavoprotein [Bacteroidota bacterium]